MLEKETGDRTFMNRSEIGIEVFIVLNSITKKEQKELKSSLSVIYQNYEIPFLILKYKHMSFDLPLMPNTRVNTYTNRLLIYIIDSKGYVLKEQRILGLNESLADNIIAGINSISARTKEEIANIALNKIYPQYTMQQMLKGGIRQRFERN